MLRELRDYYRPTDLDEALALLNQPGLRSAPLAGGTELLGRRDREIQAVVDLQDLGLDYLRADRDGLYIGALTALQTLVTAPALRTYASGIVARAAEHSAQFTERNAATVGGTVASGSGSHDLLVAFLACDAEVSLRSLQGTKRVALRDLLADRTGFHEGGTLVLEVVLPVQPADARFAQHRVARTPHDRAIVNVAVRGSVDGRFRTVRVAAGGAAPHAVRLTAVERMLEGQAATATPDLPEAVERDVVEPPSDHIASSEYRRAMVVVLLGRALQELAGHA